MADIAWHLLQPVDTGALASQGFATGMALTKRVQQQQALRDYMANPDSEQAYGTLASYDPQTAEVLASRRAATIKATREMQDRERAVALGELATVDASGAAQEATAAGDFDLAKTFTEMDDAQRKRTAEGFTAAAPIAFKLRQIADPAERQALFEQARPYLEASGFSRDKLDSFDVTNDTALDAIISSGQKVADLVEQGKIHWQTVPGEGGSAFAVDFMGRPVGKDNPYAAGARANMTGTADAPTHIGGEASARGIRNNNPLNLTKSQFTSSQPGFAGTDEGGRYARFRTPEEGLAAGQRLLGSYLTRGYDTPAEIIGRWAPAKENGEAATRNYTAYVASRLGIAASQSVTPDMLPALMQAMAEWENGGRKGGQRRVLATGEAPHVGSKAEFDALPNGTVFIAPDGSRRVKS